MNTNNTECLDDIQKRLTSFHADFQAILSWAWDDRFSGVLAQFNTEEQEGICTGLLQNFGAGWSASTIGDAPDPVRSICDELGGLRGGQLLWATDSDSMPFAVAALWPWNNGKVVSLRIMIIGSDSPEELSTSLKDWFGIKSK
jgi:hypothetical protein